MECKAINKIVKNYSYLQINDQIYHYSKKIESTNHYF